MYKIIVLCLALWVSLSAAGAAPKVSQPRGPIDANICGTYQHIYYYACLHNAYVHWKIHIFAGSPAGTLLEVAVTNCEGIIFAKLIQSIKKCNN